MNVLGSILKKFRRGGGGSGHAHSDQCGHVIPKDLSAMPQDVFFAAKMDNLALATSLVAAKPACVFDTEADGTTALHWAVMHESKTAVAKFLIAHGTFFPNNTYTRAF